MGERKRHWKLRQRVRDEFDFHLEMTESELVERGLSPADARAEASRRFGRLDRYRIRCHEIGKRQRRYRQWRETMTDLRQDLRFAFRRLVRNPLFSTVALVTLALGIGANTAVFTLVNSVVLRPLPYVEPQRLVSISLQATDGDDTDSFSFPDYNDLSSQSETLQSAGFWTWWSMDITDGDEPRSVQSVRVSANMLDIIGVEPAQGRLFRPEEGEPGNDQVAIVSHRLWQGHYGADPQLVGSQIEIDGRPHVVVGIMPAGFRFPYVDEYGAGFWTPIALDPEEEVRRARWINVVGRLADAATIEQACSEATTIGARLAGQFPQSNAGWTFAVASLYDSVVSSETRAALWILYGVVAFVLLIACANLANLLLARMESRQHEIAVRAALGAGRARLLRDLLGESALLSIGGGVAGLLVARWGLELFVSWVPDSVPRVDEISIDGAVLSFAMLITAATGVLFGLLPAANAARHDLQNTLKSSSARATGAGRNRFRAALVVVEVALALVLLVGAGLLLRSFNLLTGEDVGFDPDRVLTFQVSPSSAYPDAAARNGFYRDVVERLGQMQDVESVGANTAPPLSGVDWTMTFTIEGQPRPAAGQEPTAQYNIVTPAYFRTLGIPLLGGRSMGDEDDASRPRVVLVNETFARRHWSDGDALGKYIAIGDRVGSDGAAAAAPSFEIVGIVGDTRKLGVDQAPPAEMYVPYGQTGTYFMNFVVRTRGNPAAMIDAVRARIWEINDTVALEDVATMAQLMDSSIAAPRFNMRLVGGFALLALVLATLGIYGIVAYSAAARTREIGLRMALGARATDVFRLMLGQGLFLTLVGLGFGLIGSLAAGRLLSGLVYGVTTSDPVTFVSVALLLAAVALLAAYIPARRATRIDPLVALRND